MLPATPETTPRSEAAPRGPLPRRRLRAVLPLFGALAASALPGTGGWEDAAVAAIGLLGAVATWRADARSPRDAWARAYPGVSLPRARTLPRTVDGARHLARVCAEVAEAMRALDEAPRRGLRGALSARRSRRQLQTLPVCAADLACRLETLDALEDPRVAPRRQAVAEDLAAVAPLARRLRTAALREDLREDLPTRALHRLSRQERVRAAEQDGDDEMVALQALLERTSA